MYCLVFWSASYANIWEKFSVLSGSLNVEERNGVDVRDGRGGSEAWNPRSIEEKTGREDREDTIQELNEQRQSGGTGEGMALSCCNVLIARDYKKTAESQYPCGAKQQGAKHPGVL